MAKDLIRLSGYAGREDEMITYVEDRVFNDFRYHINSDRLTGLGWREQVSWEDGLKITFEWYQKNSLRFGEIYDFKTFVIDSVERIASIAH